MKALRHVASSLLALGLLLGAFPAERRSQVIAWTGAVGALGASVTVPHKEAALAACADHDASARAVGAANCLAFVDGQAIAHNTDAGGFVVFPLHATPPGIHTLTITDQDGNTTTMQLLIQ